MSEPKGSSGDAGAVGGLFARLLTKKPVTDTCEVALDPAALARVTAARDALNQAKFLPAQDDAAVVRSAERELKDAEIAAVDASVTLHFRTLSRPAYEALLLAHQRKDGDQGAELYDVTTLMPALVAATVYDPETDEQPVLTAEQVAGLFQAWNQGEVDAVWAKARDVCISAPDARLLKGDAATAVSS